LHVQRIYSVPQLSTKFVDGYRSTFRLNNRSRNILQTFCALHVSIFVRMFRTRLDAGRHCFQRIEKGVRFLFGVACECTPKKLRLSLSVKIESAWIFSQCFLSRRKPDDRIRTLLLCPKPSLHASVEIRQRVSDCRGIDPARMHHLEGNWPCLFDLAVPSTLLACLLSSPGFCQCDLLPFVLSIYVRPIIKSRFRLKIIDVQFLIVCPSR